MTERVKNTLGLLGLLDLIYQGSPTRSQGLRILMTPSGQPSRAEGRGQVEKNGLLIEIYPYIYQYLL
jgi:hypothetical protein